MKYIKYLFYIVEHKYNVGVECLKSGLFIHFITHDLSKFRLSEFIPYARFFHSKNRAKNYKKSDESDVNFQTGWNLHQKRNKHHWNYWVSITRKNEIIPLPMPKKYIIQMVCDWRGMARKFGGTWQEYFSKSKKDFILHTETLRRLEGLIKE